MHEHHGRCSSKTSGVTRFSIIDLGDQNTLKTVQGCAPQPARFYQSCQRFVYPKLSLLVHLCCLPKSCCPSDFLKEMDLPQEWRPSFRDESLLAKSNLTEAQSRKMAVTRCMMGACFISNNNALFSF